MNGGSGKGIVAYDRSKKKAEGRTENRNKNRYLITRVSERKNKPAENPDACTRNFRSDERGRKVVLVSSGAIGLGVDKLKLAENPPRLRQAATRVGRSA